MYADNVKFFVIRPFTDLLRAFSSKKIKCYLEKNYRVALASPYRQRLLLYLFFYSIPRLVFTSDGVGVGVGVVTGVVRTLMA